MNIRLYSMVFKQLLLEELIVFRKHFISKIIDLFIGIGLTTAVAGYIMPSFGIMASFGVFQLASLIASTGLFEIFPNAMHLLVDFEGERVISYHLTLPLPSWLIFMKKVLYFAISGFILSVCTIPMGKLVLWNQFNLAEISPLQLISILIIMSLFFWIIYHMGGELDSKLVAHSYGLDTH